MLLADVYCCVCNSFQCFASLTEDIVRFGDSLSKIVSFSLISMRAILLTLEDISKRIQVPGHALESATDNLE